MILKDNKIVSFQLTERDVNILLFLLDTRFLSREQIERLFFSNESLTPTTKKKANRRLTKMVNHGFLERLYKPVTVGKAQGVYGLGKQGYQLLSKVLEQDQRNLIFKKKANKVEFLFLEHNLGIAELRVGLELAKRNNPAIDLLFWRRESKELNDRVNDPSKRQKYLPVTPDAFFGLQTNLGRSYFFLEVDMATQEHRRIARKIIAYRQYWKKGLYGQKYGFNSFRVLFVTTTQRRMTNLLKTAEKTGAKNMFLFATQSDVTEGKILDPIWISPATENISII